MHEEVVTLGRSEEDGYEIALRRRVIGDTWADELIINGAFAMDSTRTQSEIALGEALGENPGHILVGGLGLGFTTEYLLDQGATQIDVVELSSALIDWAHQGLTGTLGKVAHDPRVRLHHGDVSTLLTGQPTIPGLFGPWDGICLDIDNGPEFLIHDDNARLYTREGIQACLRHLKEGGMMAVWSQGPCKEFWLDLTSIDPDATERLIMIDRGNRRADYAIYTISKP
jgi:spermidine synthase